MAHLCILLIILGILGARIAHVVVDHQTYWNSCFHPEALGLEESHCLRVLNFGEGGLTFYGGVIAGMIVMTVFFVRRKKQNKPLGILSILDMLAAALAVAHAFGRIGCLAAGCCWGAITKGTIGVTYDSNSFAFAELVNRPELHDMMISTGRTPLLHATQIYEAVGEFILYGILWLMHCKKTKPGRMVGFWFVGYGILRFIVEFMRDDVDRGYYFEKVSKTINSIFMVPEDHATILSTSQGIAIVMVFVGMVALVSTLFKKHTVTVPQAASPESPSRPMAAPTTSHTPSNPMTPPISVNTPSNPIKSPAASHTPSKPTPALPPTHTPSGPISAPQMAKVAIRPPSKSISSPVPIPPAFLPNKGRDSQGKSSSPDLESAATMSISTFEEFTHQKTMENQDEDMSNTVDSAVLDASVVNPDTNGGAVLAVNNIPDNALDDDDFIDDDDDVLNGEKTCVNLTSMYYEGEDE